VTVTDVQTIRCDCCKNIIANRTEDGQWDNIVEVQEMHSINFVGGYGSLFGDMNRVKGDFCQSCLVMLLGKFLTISEAEYEEGEEHQ
jgi:hypothetical protein